MEIASIPKAFELYKGLDEQAFFIKMKVFVPDRPGSLARLAELFGKNQINIVYFYYNRSEHPNRVIIEGKFKDISSWDRVYQSLAEQGFFEEIYQENFEITEPEGVFKLAIFVENKPGTLATIAKLLKEYQANVVYMTFNEYLSENKAIIAFYLSEKQKAQELLYSLNQAGYHYSLEYLGKEEETNRLLGLNLLERFYFNLRKVLSEEEVAEIKRLIEASKYLSESLINFNKEAGKNLEAGEVFGNILNFAIYSRTKIGPNFSFTRLPSIPLGDAILHTFKPPTGGNLYVFQVDHEYYLIDTCYGIYYQDIKDMFYKQGIDPENIKKIYLSHADADHVGLTGHFEEEFQTEVWCHKDALGVMEKENRVYGVPTPLYELNHYFTILVNYFTKTKFPKNPKVFNHQKVYETLNGFPVIDFFNIGSLKFKVIESLGGHIPGQVFFLCEEFGLLFTADYLLYVPSLTEEEKKVLNIPKFLMTSTNANSSLFKKEMELLKVLAKNLDEKLKTQGRGLIIFPGHGDYYPARVL
ncbi:MBL fold metallo-hydrolase [Thermodesulfobacterium sp. TA1]|uniref:MBL fold metallo-hydrolase n=1 Tax=Thermodesulfobacterium sp. TA1 TaxID=2234087 RepID=UPI0012325D26|nr:MBL fold metallo-hydrolase [Thermodesulfobacterium sp. TA1]QER42082.1 MBL fold metallo-hydrolase [Thermodesulfobacterium sp. TA1]